MNYTRYVSSVSTNAFPSAAQGCWGEMCGPESLYTRTPLIALMQVEVLFSREFTAVFSILDIGLLAVKGKTDALPVFLCDFFPGILTERNISVVNNCLCQNK